ncbi:MAG TPA: 4Fe-4S binding protein [Candidatus Gastranaerophilales bacterium]|nr:4Fe-4S binding protein [Candidatus Gastranaerophilales bacterium]
MKRKIIKINEEKCNGCGLCIPDCPEGALQVIDGKARLISDLFCDGLGACIKTCPQDAMTTEEREAEAYDEYKVMENVVKGGINVIKAHLLHLKEHGEEKFYEQAVDYLKKNDLEVPEIELKPLPCGCPGTMQKDLSKEKKRTAHAQNTNLQSELNNWPIQLKLLNPNAPYLKNADLVIAADCTAFSYANFHQKFLKDRVLIMLCPKLDSDLSHYVDKLTMIFDKQEIKSVTLVHMEVPCCGGVEMIIKEAMQKAGKNIIIKDYTVSISGELV